MVDNHLDSVIDRSLYRPLFGGFLALSVVLAVLFFQRLHALNEFSGKLLIAASANKELGTAQIGKKVLPDSNTVAETDQQTIEYRGHYLDRKVVWIAQDWEKELHTCLSETIDRGESNCNPPNIAKRIEQFVDFSARFHQFTFLTKLNGLYRGETHDYRIAFWLQTFQRTTDFFNPFGAPSYDFGSAHRRNDIMLKHLIVMFFSLFPFWSDGMIWGSVMYPGIVMLPLM